MHTYIHAYIQKHRTDARLCIGIQFEAGIAALANFVPVRRTRCPSRLFAILAQTFVGKALGVIRAHPPATVATVASVASVFRTVRGRAPNTIKTGTLVGYVTTITMVMHECIAMFSCKRTQRPLAM